MEKFYLCPRCHGHLKVGEYIIFTARNKNKDKGLLLLHPEIGNYSSIKHPDFEFTEGEGIEFYCPLCQSRLVSSFDDKLVQVIMVDKNAREYEIYFSRIAGEHSTYQVKGDEAVMVAGEHAARYTYFKIPDRLMKYL